MRLLMLIIFFFQIIIVNGQGIDSTITKHFWEQIKKSKKNLEVPLSIGSYSIHIEDTVGNLIVDTIRICKDSLKWYIDSLNFKRKEFGLFGCKEFDTDILLKPMVTLNQQFPEKLVLFDYHLSLKTDSPFMSQNLNGIEVKEKFDAYTEEMQSEFSSNLNVKYQLKDSLKFIKGINLPDSIPEIGFESVESDIQKYLDSDQLESSLLQRTEISEVNELIDESELEAEKARRMYDPQVAKEELVNKAKGFATNHFAGHEEELKSAMDKVAKLKAKLKETDEVVTLLRNRQTVKQKRPLMERFRPGITVQLSKANAIRFDFNPYIAYQVFPPIFVGLGWNQRAVFDHSSRELVNSERVFGPRLFFDYSLKKGFVPHFEIEYLNTPVKRLPDNLLSERQWVWTSMVGMKKEYRISKSIQGNVQVLYNIFDFKHKSPYENKLNVRMGIDIIIKRPKHLSRKFVQ